MRIVRFVLVAVLSIATLSLSSACATFKPNPNDSEIQQTRKLALQIFSAVEIAGTSVEAVQTFEIELYRAGKVTPETHRLFQTDLLIASRIVRQSLTSIQMATRVPDLRATVQVIITNLDDLKRKYGEQVPALNSMLGMISASLTVVLTILGV